MFRDTEGWRFARNRRVSQISALGDTSSVSLGRRLKMLDRTVELDTLPAASESDVRSPEAVVQALYDVISGHAGEERDWDRLRSLFDPRVRFLIGRWLADPETPRQAVFEWDLESFIAEGRDYWLQHGFWEAEVASKIQRFGNIAHVLSSYVSHIGTPDSEPIGRGVNSVQLVRYASRWFITSIVWDVESVDLPIPQDLVE